MCSANNQVAQSAQTKTSFYKNPQFWRSLGTGLAVGAGVMGASGAYSAGLAEDSAYQAQARSVESQAALDQISTTRQNRYDLQNVGQEVKQIRRAGKKNFAKQLTAAAASGMDLSSVSLEDAVLDSLRSEQEDIDLIKRTASARAREADLQAQLNAINAQGQAAQMRVAGRYAKKAGKINAYSSLLSSAASVAGMWGGR